MPEIQVVVSICRACRLIRKALRFHGHQAKTLPASLARAVLIVELSASKLVRDAMSLIELMTSLIFFPASASPWTLEFVGRGILWPLGRAACPDAAETSVD